jgi:hypothetical protein
VSVPVQSYRKWKGVFTTGGALFVRKDGKNHYVWTHTPVGETQGVLAGFVAHSEGSDVDSVYINKARKVWKLTKGDGVTDHDFVNGDWPKNSP